MIRSRFLTNDLFVDLIESQHQLYEHVVSVVVDQIAFRSWKQAQNLKEGKIKG
jgi:hypothetical protein